MAMVMFPHGGHVMQPEIAHMVTRISVNLSTCSINFAILENPNSGNVCTAHTQIVHQLSGECTFA